MARDRATIFTAIWSDADWKALTSDEQRLYMLLMTHPSLSYAGVADWRPGRLAKMCSDMTADKVEALGASLQSKRFIYADEESEEVLIRSYIRHDGVLNHPKLAISFANAYTAVASSNIQKIIVHELTRLQGEHPDWRAFSFDRVTKILRQPSAPIEDVTLGVTPGATHGVTHGVTLSPTLEVGVSQPLAQPLGLELPTATATATTPSIEGGSGGKRSPERPLPANWAPNAKHKTRAHETGLDVYAQAEAFKLHAETHDRRVRNWDAAFTQWLIKGKGYAEEARRSEGRSQWDMARAWNPKKD